MGRKEPLAHRDGRKGMWARRVFIGNEVFALDLGRRKEKPGSEKGEEDQRLVEMSVFLRGLDGAVVGKREGVLEVGWRENLDTDNKRA